MVALTGRSCHLYQLDSNVVYRVAVKVSRTPDSIKKKDNLHIALPSFESFDGSGLKAHLFKHALFPSVQEAFDSNLRLSEFQQVPLEGTFSKNFSTWISCLQCKSLYTLHVSHRPCLRRTKLTSKERQKFQMEPVHSNRIVFQKWVNRCQTYWRSWRRRRKKHIHVKPQVAKVTMLGKDQQ